MRSLLGIAGLLAVSASSALAGTTVDIGAAHALRWDFSGVFNTTWGTGSGLPGVVAGASISGSIESASDFEFHSFYHKFDGDHTSYHSASAVLNYTVGSSGVYHSYTLTDIFASITQLDVGNAYRVQFSAPFFQLVKDVTGSEITTPTFQSFSDAMARGMSDGTGHITIANGFWGNANTAGLSAVSMTVVPEPLSVMLLGLGTAGFVSRRRRMLEPYVHAE